MNNEATEVTEVILDRRSVFEQVDVQMTIAKST